MNNNLIFSQEILQVIPIFNPLERRSTLWDKIWNADSSRLSKEYKGSDKLAETDKLSRKTELFDKVSSTVHLQKQEFEHLDAETCTILQYMFSQLKNCDTQQFQEWNNNILSNPSARFVCLSGNLRVKFLQSLSESAREIYLNPTRGRVPVAVVFPSSSILDRAVVSFGTSINKQDLY